MRQRITFSASIACVMISCIAFADPARDILDASGVKGGLVVHLVIATPFRLPNDVRPFEDIVLPPFRWKFICQTNRIQTECLDPQGMSWGI